jgi:hypothetical protein
MGCHAVMNRKCSQLGCMKDASCETLVSGFYVTACKEHHDCRLKYK